MRKLSLWFVPIILIGLLRFSGGASAGKLLVGFTPTAYLFLPAILNHPEPTPTSTPTRTPTATSLPPLPTPSTYPVEGQLTMVENKSTYATNIEWIKFWELIHNISPETGYYGVLGVNVEGPYTFFQTSWSGNDMDTPFLQIEPNCYGPSGGTCAPDPASGQAQDHIIVSMPGTYRLTLWVCHSEFLICRGLKPGTPDWRPLGQPQTIVAIDWTPTPPGTGASHVKTVEQCRLITDDPHGIYLSCPKAELNSKRHAAGR